MHSRPSAVFSSVPHDTRDLKLSRSCFCLPARVDERRRRRLFRRNSPVLAELQVENTAVVVIFSRLSSNAREHRRVNPVVIPRSCSAGAQYLTIPQPTESHHFRLLLIFFRIDSRQSSALIITTRLVSINLFATMLHFPIISRNYFSILHFVSKKKVSDFTSRH